MKCCRSRATAARRAQGGRTAPAATDTFLKAVRYWTLRYDCHIHYDYRYYASAFYNTFTTNNAIHCKKIEVNVLTTETKT